MDTFERGITAEINRIDALFNEDLAMVQGSAVRGRLRKRKIKHVKLQFRAGTGTTFRG